MENLIIQYKWNDLFEKIKDFGLLYIDNEKCLETSKLRGDTHTIIHRLIPKEIPDWIKQGIPEDIIVLQIFAVEPNSVGLIHKDGVDRLCAFNIPLQNCDSGTMDWFEESSYSTYSVKKNYTTIRLTNEQMAQRAVQGDIKYTGKEIESTPAFSTLVTQPSLVNTNVWHRVDNRSALNFRWMLSLRFRNNLSIELMKEKFNDAFK